LRPGLLNCRSAGSPDSATELIGAGHQVVGPARSKRGCDGARRARSKGDSAYVGDGSNRWPAAHRLDAARLFRLAIEKAPAGAVLHGVGDEGVPVRDIAEAIGRHLDLPVVALLP
jgi:nucleoside-diphosphate-sugar epimerase